MGFAAYTLVSEYPIMTRKVRVVGGRTYIEGGGTSITDEGEYVVVDTTPFLSLVCCSIRTYIPKCDIRSDTAIKKRSVGSDP